MTDFPITKDQRTAGLGPSKHKGAKMYAEFRQWWLKQEGERLSGKQVGCETCMRVFDKIIFDGRLWRYQDNRLCVGHRQGRLSHPEGKMSREGVMHQCYKCNGKMAGQRNVLPRPDGTKPEEEDA